ncbi:DNA polymerase III subunit delta' [Prosthecomicrobium sp. N25]|uniref:DNA polymerase III subunit delta' n=1 Tax=Prosthecomicrobium sp. N25 TaxID=3129254 RepID=UPI0030785174
MARASTQVQEAAPEVDSIEGLPLPRERHTLIGQADAEATLLDAYRSGRIHHGWLLGGPKGVGKATLAFRFARFVLANPDPASAAVRAARDLSVDPASPVARRVASGAHADLLALRRPWDEKNKRFKTELPVDEVRRTVGFFGSTAAEGGWRIAIVDPADDMNAAAANALLKILEEPPARSLFLVVSHQPGRLLPTIRSRCRRLGLQPLSEETVVEGLRGLGFAERTDASTMAAAARIAEGSLRRAILMIESDGVALHRRIDAIMARLPTVDLRELHKLADEVAGRGADEAFETAVDFFQAQAVARARKAAAAGEGGRAAAWAEAHRTVARDIATVDALNLDRRAALLSLVRTLVEAARY